MHLTSKLQQVYDITQAGMRRSLGFSARKEGACLLLVACALLFNPAWQTAVWSAPATPIVMGTDHEETSFIGKWERRIYIEAFKRLDIPMQFAVFPTKRLSVVVDQGAVDGELARVHGYAAAHPNLVRVEESVFDVQFALFVAHPTVRLDRLDELPAARLRGEFRRGVMVCESTLRQWQPAERLFDVTTTEQGLKNLLEGPADFFYCNTDLAVLSALHSEQFKGVTTIRKLLALGEAQPLYPYLHRKHAELAPRLAATLKKMKAEGLLARYLRDVEREFTAK